MSLWQGEWHERVRDARGRAIPEEPCQLAKARLNTVFEGLLCVCVPVRVVVFCPTFPFVGQHCGSNEAYTACIPHLSLT